MSNVNNLGYSYATYYSWNEAQPLLVGTTGGNVYRSRIYFNAPSPISSSSKLVVTASIQELSSFASSIKADLKIVEVYPKTSRYFTSIFNIEPLIKQLGYKKIKNSFRKNLYSNGNHNIFLQMCTCSIISEQSNKTELCKENNDLFISQDGRVNLCRATNDTIDLYDSIKERDDNELASKIKKVYEEMGNGCICQVKQ